MITNWKITGDTHGDFSRFYNYDGIFSQNKNAGLIILGDAGWNYYGLRDVKAKSEFHKSYKFYVYCVRGNHEMRPQDVPGMELHYDENVKGEVYYEPDFPRIRYFKDWGIYYIRDFYNKEISIGIIGGAYSVDKYYRLERGWSWFPNEELTDEEMHQCCYDMGGKHIDIMLTHTCPVQWEPTDLFLSMVDQSTVSKRMEEFLEYFESTIHWNIWLFGHYHADRIEQPYVEQFYIDTDDIENIVGRWAAYGKGEELPWYIAKSPNFKKGT